MRAALVDRYGPPERITVAEAPQPEPRPGEALVRVEAAAVTAGDARLRAGRFPKGSAHWGASASAFAARAPGRWAERSRARSSRSPRTSRAWSRGTRSRA
ncbi:hypothetical protein GCM10029992_52670 [Glycomyces albus]